WPLETVATPARRCSSSRRKYRLSRPTLARDRRPSLPLTSRDRSPLPMRWFRVGPGSGSGAKDGWSATPFYLAARARSSEPPGRRTHRMASAVAQAGGMTMRIALSEHLVRAPAAERFAHARELGADGVELTVGPHAFEQHPLWRPGGAALVRSQAEAAGVAV